VRDLVRKECVGSDQGNWVGGLGCLFDHTDAVDHDSRLDQGHDSLE
jgi:hypothetical protein